MADNKIRLKQLEQTELSGYIGGVYAGTASGKANDLIPNQSGVHNLGQADLPWKTIYAQSISVTGTDGTIDKLYPATGDLIPIESGKYDLGSMDAPWDDLYLSWNSIHFVGAPGGPIKIGVNNAGVLTSTNSAGITTKMAQGPQGSRGGFGGDGTLYHYIHQTGATQVYPDTGHFTFNSTDKFNDATHLYVHDYGYYSQTGKLDLVDNTSWLTSLFSSTSDIKGSLRFFNHDNPSKFSSYNITGSAVDNEGYYTVPLSYVNSSESDFTITGAFTSGEKVVVSFTPKGDLGQIGPQGPENGPKGDQGPQGPQGAIGAQGPQGPANGPQGAQGKSVNWSGLWQAGANYGGRDAVFYGNSSYISVADNNQAHAPIGTTSDLYWDVMASGGLAGPQGPQGVEGGPPGAAGTIGPQGPTGAQGAVGPVGIVSGQAESIEKTIQQNDFWIGGNSFGVVDVLRFNGSEYVKARANGEANSEVIGVVKSLDTGNNSFTLVTEGFVSWPTGTLSSTPYAAKTEGGGEFQPGKIYWLDDAEAGLITVTEPTTIGSVSKPVFFATSASGGFIQNYRGQVIESGLGPKFLIPGIGDVTRHGIQTITSKRLSSQTSFGTSVLNWGAGTINIDFDGEPFQTLNILGPTQFGALNIGNGKTITLKLKNSSAVDWTLTFNSNFVFVGSLAPTSLKAGKAALVSFTAFGTNQSDVIVGYADQK